MGIPTVTDLASSSSTEMLTRQSSHGNPSSSPLRSQSGANLPGARGGATHGQASDNFSPILLQVWLVLQFGNLGNNFVAWFLLFVFNWNSLKNLIHIIGRLAQDISLDQAQLILFTANKPKLFFFCLIEAWIVITLNFNSHNLFWPAYVYYTTWSRKKGAKIGETNLYLKSLRMYENILYKVMNV